MSTTSGSIKLSLVCAALAGLLMVVVVHSQVSGQGKVQAGQEDKKATAKQPPKDEGNADKKDAPDRPLKKFMRQKLDASNLILEGLCTEDLTMVAEGSEVLMTMGREVQWRVSNDILYNRYSKEFVNAVEELQKEAEDNDMNGTSMAWVNVTMKCLKCHEWVRNAVLADSDKQALLPAGIPPET